MRAILGWEIERPSMSQPIAAGHDRQKGVERVITRDIRITSVAKRTNCRHTAVRDGPARG